jgi:hypothetical protein
VENEQKIVKKLSSFFFWKNDKVVFLIGMNAYQKSLE